MVFWGLSGWRRLAAGNVVGQLATQGGRVEGESSWATLQPRVAAYAKPVTDAALLDGKVTVGVVFANRMFLAVWDVVGPVAGVHNVVVQQGKGTLLYGGGAVPALPITSAARLMGEHAVLPVAVLRTDRRLSHDPSIFVGASDSVWIVTVAEKASVLSGKCEAVGAELQCGDAVRAVVVIVAVLLVIE